MGGLTKLMIIAHNNPDDRKEVKKYTALINPSAITADYQVSYSNKQAASTTTPQLKYQHMPSGKIKFKLIFDGTGLISTIKKSDKSKTVSQQIEEFKDTTIEYQGSIHRPYFLTLVWGKSLFRGVLTDLSIEYKLFKPDGTPIRAEADVTFQTSDSAKKAEEDANKKSSDLTHLRQIKAGDRLPNICKNIYDGPNFYIQVAKHNQLNHLRSLKPGIQLNFPPLNN